MWRRGCFSNFSFLSVYDIEGINIAWSPAISHELYKNNKFVFDVEKSQKHKKWEFDNVGTSKNELKRGRKINNCGGTFEKYHRRSNIEIKRVPDK